MGTARANHRLEAIDHPTEDQLLALARRDFTAHERVLVPSRHG